jgi:Cof subfamily protein (haloacid dehalogenase superfamily)
MNIKDGIDFVTLLNPYLIKGYFYNKLITGKQMSEVRMVITDLDGTLLQKDHTISKRDNKTLEKLGRLGVCRVAATGRNLFKVRQVLSVKSPFDYVILSSGAGIMEWKSQKLIRAISIPADETGKIIRFLIDNGQNIKVSRELPDNHNFAWWQSYECPELKRYIEHHTQFGEGVVVDPEKPFVASQILLFFPKTSEKFEYYREMLLNEFPDLSIIRTTSPIDPDFTWMEIFPQGVSKARGIEEICRITGISRENTLSIGNDYNDLEMLEFTKHSYVVDNAPEDLKLKYLISLGHHQDGFSHAVNKHIPPENIS